jgi:hypothetical protein
VNHQPSSSAPRSWSSASKTDLAGLSIPGRIGVVVRENMFGRELGGYWYVQLEATRRAKQRIALFCAKELERAQECAS